MKTDELAEEDFGCKAMKTNERVWIYDACRPTLIIKLSILAS